MRLRAFVSSWLFAPYNGSADLDLFKRLRHVDADFEIVQAKRENPDPRLMRFPCPASFTRTEIDLKAGHPRSRAARDLFISGVRARFDDVGAECDVLLSHSNEVPSHAAALELRRQSPELPWVAYFGDVVSRNPFVRHMSEYPLFEEDCYVEHQTLREADVVICNNEYQRRVLTSLVSPERHARFVVIPHAYDPALYESAPVAPNRVFTFMHLGALYSVKRQATPVLKAIDVLLEVYPEYRGRFEVVFVGDEVPDGDVTTWQRMKERDHARFFPGVPYLASLDLMRRADALLIIDGVFDELEFSPFLPGKLADYLGADRPLMAVTMKQGPTADLLEARGELFAHDDSPERIAFVMKRHLDKRVPPARAPRAMRAEVVGAQMELVLRAAAGGPSVVAALPGLLERLKRGIPEEDEEQADGTDEPEEASA